MYRGIRCLLIDHEKNTAEIELYNYTLNYITLENKKRHKNFNDLEKEIREFIKKEKEVLKNEIDDKRN